MVSKGSKIGKIAADAIVIRDSFPNRDRNCRGALVAPMTTKGSTARSRVRTQIRDYMRSNGITGLGDGNLGNFLKTLESTTDESNLRFDPKEVAGTWRVIHAPHIEFLSKLFARFSPIEYHLTPDLKMTSCVKYTTSVGGASGWLCTSGFYTVEVFTGNVKIVWDRVWWNADERERPTPPEQGSFADVIQILGKIGFIEPLSFFLVKYVDKEIAIFQFFGFTISAMKQPNLKPGILVSDAAR
eukprot:scaffold10861_cov180-Amphora_coffeaeformis.AAC.26